MVEQGTIRGCKLALKFMGKNGRQNESTGKGGLILNISSVHGILSNPSCPTYSAGKAGILAYTQSAGHELEFAHHGVKMMALCPNAVNTPIHDYSKYV